MSNPKEDSTEEVKEVKRVFRQFHTLEEDEIAPELKKDMDDYFKRVAEYKKENNEQGRAPYENIPIGRWYDLHTKFRQTYEQE